MATYTVTVPDAADAIMREVAPSMGWDQKTDFSAFIETMFVQYAAGLAARAKAEEAAQAAAQATSQDVNTAFGV